MQKMDFILTFNMGYFWKVELLEEIDSAFQNIKVIEHPKFGRALVLDNCVMFSEYDEHKYHELIVYPAMHSLKECKNVLILGGGDTLTAKRVLEFPVEKVTQIDIDYFVFDITKKYFGDIVNDSYLSDPRLELKFENGLYALNGDNKYDLIILDLTDPVEEGNLSSKLFNESFFEKCKNSLTNEGILVIQSGCPYLYEKPFKSQQDSLKKLFKNTWTYGAYMHCYNTHQYFIACSNETKFNKKLIKSMIRFDWDYKIFN